MGKISEEFPVDFTNEETKESKLNITPAAIGAMAAGDVANFLLAATPGGIENQEAQGQQTLVNSQQMPIKLNSYDEEFRDKDATYIYKKWGCKIGKTVDKLFIEVELPAGWKKVATDHSMWSKLVDNNGRVRASIFYKAAFYDLESFINLETRFHVTYEMVDWKVSARDHYEKISKEQRYGVIKDSCVIVFKTEPRTFTKPYPIPTVEERAKIERGATPEGHYAWWKEHDNWEREINNEAEAVLVAQFPEYKDYFKYWEAENVKF